MKKYILKHQNIDVIEFEISQDENKIKYLKILDEKFSPINTKETESEKINSFNKWLYNRCVPSSRSGIRRLEKKYNVTDIREIMILKKGLSLSDHFWIDSEPFNNKWENINLFENKYNENFGKVLFDDKLRLVTDDYSFEGYLPDLTTRGKLKKYWVYDEKEKKSYLYKGSSGTARQEPFNEYYSHLLLEELNFDNVAYNIKNVNDEYLSVCPCIANKETELISAQDLSLKYGIRKTYENLLDLAKRNGTEGFEDSMKKMIIFDYMTDNVDRHWDNFGILRDTVTGSWVKFAPLFDNGYILWNNDFVKPNEPSLSLSFEEFNEDNMEKYVNMRDYVKKIPDIKNIFNEAFEKYPDKDRKKSLEWGVNIKYENLCKYF